MSEPGPGGGNGASRQHPARRRATRAALGSRPGRPGRPVRGWSDGEVHDEVALKLPICTDTTRLPTL
ncbi:hypothetical protein FAGKG844_30188 [Frankia sp. AgKG'84/4]